MRLIFRFLLTAFIAFLICCATAPPSPEQMNKYIVTGRSKSELIDSFTDFEGRCIKKTTSMKCYSWITNVNSSGFQAQGRFHSFDTRPIITYNGYECVINGIMFDQMFDDLALRVYGGWESIYQSGK
jgi:hypothetical protein